MTDESLQQVHQLLRPLFNAAFFSDSLGKTAVRLGKFPVDQFHQFSWDQLNDALAQHRMFPPRIRLAHQDNEAATESPVELTYGRRGVQISRIHLTRLNRALHSGATLVLDAIDEVNPSLQALTRAFAFTFGSVPQCNAYASFKEQRGFGLHWDDHDVFVFQIAGRKHWKIYPQTRISPLYIDVERNDEKPTSAYLEFTIEEGEVIYVPRGHWHDVVGLNEPSLHLTLGITHPTSIDVMGWVRDELRHDETMRTDLPFGSTDDAQAIETAIRDRAGELLRPGFLQRFWQDRKSNLNYIKRPMLPHGLGDIDIADNALLSWTPVGVNELVVEGNELLLRGFGTEVALSVEALRAIEALSGAGAMQFAAFVKLFPRKFARSDIVGMVCLLNEHGFCSASELL